MASCHTCLNASTVQSFQIIRCMRVHIVFMRRRTRENCSIQSGVVEGIRLLAWLRCSSYQRHIIPFDCRTLLSVMSELSETLRLQQYRYRSLQPRLEESLPISPWQALPRGEHEQYDIKKKDRVSLGEAVHTYLYSGDEPDCFEVKYCFHFLINLSGLRPAFLRSRGGLICLPPATLGRLAQSWQEQKR